MRTFLKRREGRTRNKEREGRKKLRNPRMGCLGTYRVAGLPI